jgi:molecular chaperone IbpA
MTKLATIDFSPFYRNTVGIDRLLDSMVSRLDATNSGYPPYNIIKVDEDHYKIEVALAGFTEQDIDVHIHNGQLVVKAERLQEAQETVEYLHKGIGNRSFVKTFQLADYVEVGNAVFKNGILHISLERHTPEAMKPRKIAIESY